MQWHGGVGHSAQSLHIPSFSSASPSSSSAMHAQLGQGLGVCQGRAPSVQLLGGWFLRIVQSGSKSRMWVRFQPLVCRSPTCCMRSPIADLRVATVSVGLTCRNTVVFWLDTHVHNVPMMLGRGCPIDQGSRALNVNTNRSQGVSEGVQTGGVGPRLGQVGEYRADVKQFNSKISVAHPA